MLTSALPAVLRPRLIAGAAALALLAGCASAPPAQGIADPWEPTNRQVHAFNRAVDRTVLRPASEVYGTVAPAPVRTVIGNFAQNLDQPRMVVNDILQGRVEDAAANTFRFLVNSTFGLAGLLDPATDMGILARDTDFGETLHVWGAREGAYVELPLLGPSTERDAFGTAVDFALNPLRHAGLSDDQRAAVTGARVAAALGTRYRFRQSFDDVLYGSADSYAQARLLYLENRRFELGSGTEADYGDIYGDYYAE